MNNVVTPVRVRITAGNLELFRVISNGWVNASGVVSPEAFNLNDADRKDFNHLSIARSGAVTPEVAYDDRAQAIKSRCGTLNRPFKPPVGVMAVTVSEVESIVIKSPEGCTKNPLSAWDDSMGDGRSPYHGHIDFNGVPAANRGLCLLAAKTLLQAAMDRGWKYCPPTS